MKKINKKIIDYVVLGTIAAAGLGSSGYFAYDTIHNKDLTEKGVKVAELGLGLLAGGMIYTGYRVVQDDFEEEKLKKENEAKENNLEKDVQE